ncbi:hypothetical protein FQN55_007853 [Onygenales sp. PD_40]|nr:hypothetical protein FQN55_007853 [Onygenales sp. PD_40]
MGKTESGYSRKKVRTSSRDDYGVRNRGFGWGAAATGDCITSGASLSGGSPTAVERRFSISQSSIAVFAQPMNFPLEIRFVRASVGETPNLLCNRKRTLS